jgi:hypothetical protein
MLTATVPHDFLHLLTTLVPNLEYLQLYDVRADFDFAAPSTPEPYTISLPNLHTIHLESGIELSNATWDTPNLQHLGITSPEQEPTDTQTLEAPSVKGTQCSKHLKCLDIRLPYFGNFGHFLSSFPELEQLRMDHDDFSHLMALLGSQTVLPSLRVVFLDGYLDEGM